MNKLFLQLVNGQNVVNDVIRDQMKLAKSLAWRFMIANPNRKEDVESTALIALVHGVNWIYNHPEVNFTAESIQPFLNRTIRNAIIEFLNGDRMIPIARHTLHRYADLGTPIYRPSVFSSHNLEHDRDYDVPDESYVHERNASEMQTDLEKHLTQMEKSVLNLRLKEYNQYEIAKIMDCSQSWINQIIVGIRDKYTTLSVCGKRAMSVS